MWYILKQLFTSVSVKVVDIYHYSPPLRWIIVNYLPSLRWIIVKYFWNEPVFSSLSFPYIGFLLRFSEVDTAGHVKNVGIFKPKWLELDKHLVFLWDLVHLFNFFYWFTGYPGKSQEKTSRHGWYSPCNQGMHQLIFHTSGKIVLITEANVFKSGILNF